jgi:hypothetical protein
MHHDGAGQQKREEERGNTSAVAKKVDRARRVRKVHARIACPVTPPAGERGRRAMLRSSHTRRMQEHCSLDCRVRLYA